jgi:hypothetical protein
MAAMLSAADYVPPVPQPSETGGAASPAGSSSMSGDNVPTNSSYRSPQAFMAAK